MPLSFSLQLQEAHAELYSRATTHLLTTELCQGSVSDARLLVYLTQDLRYFNVGLRLFGRALALCEEGPAAIVLAKQVGFLANAENDYFRTAIAELSGLFTPAERALVHATELLEVTAYLEFMEGMLHNPNVTYFEVVTALYAMEKVYLEWAETAISEGQVPLALPYRYKEWVLLHSGDAFATFVRFLQSEVDRCGKAATTSAISAALSTIFSTTLRHEVSFFDACYHQQLVRQ